MTTGSGCKTPIGICAARWTRLNANGSPVGGNTVGAISLNGKIGTVKWTPQYYTVPEIAEPDGCGNLAVVRPPKNLLKRHDVEVDLLVGSHEIHELVQDATLLRSGGSPIGHAELVQTACGTPTTKNGVCFEAWASNYLCNQVDPNFPYARIVFSRVFFDSSSDQTLQNGVSHLILKGFTQANDQIGNGPFNDFPSDLTSLTSWTRSAFEDTALPTPSTDCGYVTTPSQS